MLRFDYYSETVAAGSVYLLSLQAIQYREERKDWAAEARELVVRGGVLAIDGKGLVAQVWCSMVCNRVRVFDTI